ncbi:hypothetical protein CXF48_05670 [Corynebacterium bovis]|uniref:Uncharacterized protein n=1 Tax=Corynebacterium bovis TaxID=36808 RepID=A0A3R8PBZ2_9CORY|nr:hypothetical protein CXF48_05670 [Corynebacterium bovis]
MQGDRTDTGRVTGAPGVRVPERGGRPAAPPGVVAAAPGAGPSDAGTGPAAGTLVVDPGALLRRAGEIRAVTSRPLTAPGTAPMPGGELTAALAALADRVVDTAAAHTGVAAALADDLAAFTRAVLGADALDAPGARP